MLLQRACRRPSGRSAKGAPIRIIGSEMIGAPDFYCMLRRASPIRRVEDLNGKTIAYSLTGSSSHAAVLVLIAQYKLAAKPDLNRQHLGHHHSDNVRAGRCRVWGGSIRIGPGPRREGPYHCNRKRCVFVAHPHRAREISTSVSNLHNRHDALVRFNSRVSRNR